MFIYPSSHILRYLDSKQLLIFKLKKQKHIYCQQGHVVLNCQNTIQLIVLDQFTSFVDQFTSAEKQLQPDRYASNMRSRGNQFYPTSCHAN